MRCDPEIQELRKWQKKLREDKHIRQRVKIFWAKQEQKGELFDSQPLVYSGKASVLPQAQEGSPLRFYKVPISARDSIGGRGGGSMLRFSFGMTI